MKPEELIRDLLWVEVRQLGQVHYDDDCPTRLKWPMTSRISSGANHLNVTGSNPIDCLNRLRIQTNESGKTLAEQLRGRLPKDLTAIEQDFARILIETLENPSRENRMRTRWILFFLHDFSLLEKLDKAAQKRMTLTNKAATLRKLLYHSCSVLYWRQALQTAYERESSNVVVFESDNWIVKIGGMMGGGNFLKIKDKKGATRNVPANKMRHAREVICETNRFTTRVGKIIKEAWICFYSYEDRVCWGHTQASIGDRNILEEVCLNGITPELVQEALKCRIGTPKTNACPQNT